MGRPNVYQFDGIEGTATLIDAFSSQMELDLDNLDTTFATLLANDWDGTAAQAFRALSTQWHAHARGIETALNAMAQNVSNASVHMNETDAMVTARVESAGD